METMVKLFYELPNGKCFAHVSRSGTTTISHQVLKQFYPEVYKEYKTQIGLSKPAVPQGYLTERWGEELPKGCLVMVRNPIERLQSMIAKTQWSEEVIDFGLGTSTGATSAERELSKQYTILKHHHISPLHCIANDNCHFVKFPEIEKACEYLEVPYEESLHLNKQRGEVEPLKAEQEKFLEESMSMEIWKSLSNK